MHGQACIKKYIYVYMVRVYSILFATLDRSASLQCYVENRNNYARNGSENVLRIPYYISNCKTATNNRVHSALSSFAVVLKLVAKAEPVK